MKKNKLLSPIFFAFTSSISLSSYCQSQLSTELNRIYPRHIRSSISLRIPKAPNLDFNNISVDPFLETMLKSYGVSIDQHSEIKYHEENSHIDLNCFNCVIRVHNDENTNAMSDNKSGGERGN